MNRYRALLVALITTLTIAACGGDDSGNGGGASKSVQQAATTETATTTTAVPEESTDPIERATQRLEAKGYVVEEATTSDAEAAISVDKTEVDIGGGDVAIFFFASNADAKAQEAKIERALGSRSEGHLLQRVRGNRLYQAINQEPFRPEQVLGMQKVVRVGEGKARWTRHNGSAERYSSWSSVRHSRLSRAEMTVVEVVTANRLAALR